MTLTPVAQLDQSILVQVELLHLLLLIQAAASNSELSKEAWKDYQCHDYDSTHDFCIACLVDRNPPLSVKQQYLCWLPIMSPQNQMVNLHALKKTQKILLNPSATEFPQIETWRKEAAKKLVSVMEHYDLTPSKKLLKLAEEA